MTAPTSHPLYEVWRTIKRRCDDPRDKDYKKYGARGIKMCPEWHDDYMKFYNWALSHGYKRGLTLDRFSNYRGYSPGNCRWLDRRGQANNRTTNTRITVNGKTLTIAQWGRVNHIKDTTIIERIRRGMSPQEAVTKPSRAYHWKK